MVSCYHCQLINFDVDYHLYDDETKHVIQYSGMSHKSSVGALYDY